MAGGSDPSFAMDGVAIIIVVDHFLDSETGCAAIIIWINDMLTNFPIS